MTGTLTARTRTGLTAREAISWWRTAPGSGAPVGFGDPVGFAISARAATWWRLDGDIPMTSTGAVLPLDGVYEIVGMDGDHELRWRDDHDGRGPAVVLADDDEQLPLDGVPVPHPARPARIGPLQQRVLAGRVAGLPRPGWVRLTTARYAPADVPVPPWTERDLEGAGEDSPVVVLEFVEYAHQDVHGNLSVIDSRHTGLSLRRRRDLHLEPYLDPAGEE